MHLNQYESGGNQNLEVSGSVDGLGILCNFTMSFVLGRRQIPRNAASVQPVNRILVVLVPPDNPPAGCRTARALVEPSHFIFARLVVKSYLVAVADIPQGDEIIRPASIDLAHCHVGIAGVVQETTREFHQDVSVPPGLDRVCARGGRLGRKVRRQDRRPLGEISMREHPPLLRVHPPDLDASGTP